MLRPEIDTLKWDVQQRLTMLEASLLWEGRATTWTLIRLFGISRGQASKDVALYRTIAPENLIYDLSEKAYLPGSSFSPRFIQGTVEEYLRLLELRSELGNSMVVPIAPLPIAIAFVRPPARKLDLDILRAIHSALREKKQLSVSYVSMNSPMRSLTLSPHTLVFSGFRWHVRAFSEEHGEFRDFVLARISQAETIPAPIELSIEHDLEWQTFEVLHIEPHPGLPEEQRLSIADDYGMENGQLKLKVRKALSFYYQRMLRLDLPQTMDPKALQIVLVAREAAS